MRFRFFFAAAASLVLGILACSSSTTDNSKNPLVNDGGGGASSAGAKGSGGAGAKGNGGKASGGASGGNTASGGTGGGDPAACEIDSGTDACRLCLAGHCCDDFKSCNADTACASEFQTYQSCVKGANGDGNVVSECFSTFAGNVGSEHSSLTACDFHNCSAECGGPLAL
jgi:hypothetical protein